MFTRVVGIVAMLWSLSLSVLGVAFGAEKDRQGFLGIVPGEVTSEIAAEYGVRTGEGVVVDGVSPGSPAAKAGLRDNDIIISANKAGITGPEEFRNTIAKMSAGEKVELTYVRGGKQKTTTVELGSREGREFGLFGPNFMKGETPSTPPHVMREPKEPREPYESKVPREPIEKEHGEKVAFAGIIAQNLTEGLRSYFRVEKGALISEVVEDSPAEKAGLKAGDVIIRIGHQDIEDESDVREAIREHQPGDRVDFVVVRERQEQTFTLTLAGQEMPDMGSLDIEIPNLEGLRDMHLMVPNEDEMRALEEKLQDLRVKINGMDPMDIHIDQLPDSGANIRIEKYMIGPVRCQGSDWERSWQLVKDRVRSEFAGLSQDFARLRDELVALGNDLLGRTA